MAIDIAARLEQRKRHERCRGRCPHSPLDREGLAAILAKFATVVVIEEHSCISGLGAQLKQLAWEVRANCTLKTFSLKDEFIHFYGNNASFGLHTGWMNLLSTASWRPSNNSSRGLMAYIDFILQVHNAAKRNYVARVTEADKAECATISKQFGFDYFDGGPQSMVTAVFVMMAVGCRWPRTW
jgi:hypothetical protein